MQLVLFSGEAGYAVGSAINRAIEKEYGQNAGTALYDIIHENDPPVCTKCGGR
jgi:hypothetical protein